MQEARGTHLAHAQEIPQAMLWRQQAEAINDIKQNDLVTFDEEKKDAMVSNLLVVLCGEAEVTPIVNTGAT